MNFQVVVSCLGDPCFRHYGAVRNPGQLLAPFAGPFTTGEAASEFLHRLLKDPHHRFDVCELRADGWPKCPVCGDDELYSLSMEDPWRKRTQADRCAHFISNLTGCYRCGTTHARMIKALEYAQEEREKDKTR